MARPKFRVAALMLVGMLTVALTTASPSWAEHHSPVKRGIHQMNFQDLQCMMRKLPTLLPPARLGNEWSAHYAHVKGSLKQATSLPISQFTMVAGNVNFRAGWHPKPYTTRAEDLAMFQLGLLVSYGHFAIANANIPEIRDAATTILGELDTISANTKLQDMNGDIKQIEQAVSDPSYNGGPTRALTAFDRWSRNLGMRVRDVYLLDGFWYYTAGIDLAGLNWLPENDKFNSPYFRDYCQLLYNAQPSTGLPSGVRFEMAQILRIHNYSWPFYTFQQKWAQEAINGILKS